MLVTKFVSLLFPPTCVLCAQRSHQPQDLCVACKQELPWPIKACQQCGLHLPASALSLHCGTCQQQPPAFDRVFALFDYQAPIDKLITAAKFQDKLIYARLLGQLLADKIQSSWYVQEALPEVIIPVPLHAQRLKERGYNQALEIAKVVAKHVKIPLHHDYCFRQKATQPQSLLAPAQRSKNVAQAFMLKKIPSLQHIAIIDDIITTGHTVNELSKILRQAGVAQIDIWSCARTQRDRA